MTHIGSNNSQQGGGLICGNLDGAFIYNIGTGVQTGALSQEAVLHSSQGSTSFNNSISSERDKKSILRFPGGSCSSVSFDPESNHWMASYKFLRQSFTHHVRGNIILDNDTENIMLNSEFKVVGGPPITNFSRNNIFSWSNESVHMASSSIGSVSWKNYLH
jgi:hypothetical protein